MLMLASKPVLVSAKRSDNGKFSKNTKTTTFTYLNPLVFVLKKQELFIILYQKFFVWSLKKTVQVTEYILYIITGQGCSKKRMCLPISSKRSTHTTNTFVSGPSGGKDFPVDDLFAFTKGLSYRNRTQHGEFKLSKHNIK